MLSFRIEEPVSRIKTVTGEVPVNREHGRGVELTPPTNNPVQKFHKLTAQQGGLLCVMMTGVACSECNNSPNDRGRFSNGLKYGSILERFPACDVQPHSAASHTHEARDTTSS
jgi:hypothetical protein